MLTSRTSDLHAHLSRRTKRHSGIHTVTPTQRADSSADPNAPKKEPVFGGFKYDAEAPKSTFAKSSIFGL
jgi:hypothetical protein